MIDKVLTEYIPPEILPGDLLCGATFNLATSFCLTKKETKARENKILGKKGLRKTLIEFHDRGYGNAGATNGHLIPGYEIPIKYGFKHIHADIKSKFDALTVEEQKGPKGEQLLAMMYASEIPKRVAYKYATLCEKLASKEKNKIRKSELLNMAKNCHKVP
jgi:formate C-acetyltransferase